MVTTLALPLCHFLNELLFTEELQAEEEVLGFVRKVLGRGLSLTLLEPGSPWAFTGFMETVFSSVCRQPCSAWTGSLSVSHTVAFAKLTSDGVWLPPIPRARICLPAAGVPPVSLAP